MIMKDFIFTDGQSICRYDGEKTVKYTSGGIERYKENAERVARSSDWKYGGEGAAFRGDMRKTGDGVDCSLSGVYLGEGDWAVYSFTADQTAGIYKKSLSDEKTPETHVINSNNLSFGQGMLDCAGGKLAVSVQRNYYNSDIGVFDLETDDYRLVTDGDTLDADPYICPDDGNIIYFSSRGAGRDNHGEFAGFSPSAICKLDLNNMTVEEVAAKNDTNYFKPVIYGGKLYAVSAPVKEKSGNAFVDFLLFPWRILQGIANCINIFVRATTGKSVTNGGANPARGRDYDSRKVQIAGNLIDVDKQLKKNASKKDSDFGFIPKSWKLVEVESGKVIKSGICDFDIDEDGTIIATNGRRVFAIKDGKCQKISNAEFCLHVSCRHSCKKPESNLFGF